MKTKLLVASALASATFVVLPSAGIAQGKTDSAPATASAEGEPEQREITVTGTRIPRPEFSGVLPGVQVTSEQIQTRGFTNALEILNDLPLVGPGASFNGNNGGQASSLGVSFVDLLDLGTNRTLTLVNGRRFVSGNSATLFVEGNTTGGQVDINVIPVGLIDRIDVLTVGGAAVYGADAIAGVVNFRLRDDYEGVSADAISGISSREDAAQYTLRGLAGKNFLDDRLNVVLSAEYNWIDGVQATRRDFRLVRANSITNFANGASRNPNFAAAIIDSIASNNAAFLRATDDGIPASAYGTGLINTTLSFNGTILRPTGPALAPINGGLSPLNQYNANYPSAQLIAGLPGVPLTFTTAGSAISGNGLNGRTTPATGLPITTFAPTTLPAGVTAAQVFTQFGVTPPAGATAGQLTTLAVNVLQANRPTAREFFAANPNVPLNYFLGTFNANLPRIANTDTTLVSVGRPGGATVQVPVNQVLPFVAVPLEFNRDGTIRPFDIATGFGPNSIGTFQSSPNPTGGFGDALANTVLRVQQSRAIGLGKINFKVTPDITFFSENLFARVESVALRNSPSQNFVSTGAENAPLIVNVNNPFLSDQARTTLAAVGISATNPQNNGNFLITRQNQDIFEENPFRATSNTFRTSTGVRADAEVFGRKVSAELSVTYGRASSTVTTTQIKDLEYILALDAVRDSSGQIRCNAQVNPAAFLGRSPQGVVANLTRQPGADGIPTEVVITPVVTQDLINACQPLNPFGYNNMSDAAKAYVRGDVRFRNVSEQLFLQGTFTTTLFELPAGPIGVSGAAEYRRESMDFRSDELNRLGRYRTAPSAQTDGTIEVFEAGGEVRIPIFGNGFADFLGDLELSPAIRVSRQDGSATRYRNLAGQIITPRSKGDPATIWTIAGTWRPIQDITLRGNVTRAVRQPSIVELFLGGQPAFAVPTDPCGPTNIAGGSSAANRRANCRAAVIAAGLANDAAGADSFLATFVPTGASLPGTFSGGSDLAPERSRSWTVGTILTPRFVPGLTLSADYYHLNLSNIIQPTNLTQALNFCYDSATFPDTSPQTGSNTCTFFSRQADFQVAPGFASGFINLSATRLRAFNFAFRYETNLPSDLGKVSLQGTAYHLRRFAESAAGDFSDVIRSDGTFNRPKWETQARLRYDRKSFYSQLTWNWRQKTRIFVNGAPATIENFPGFVYPAVSQFDLALGLDATDKLRLQFVVFNMTDETFVGQTGLAQAQFYDQIGRRFQFSANMKF